jgi:hypothetical protein
MGHEEPRSTTVYQLYAQDLYDDGAAIPWEPTACVSDDLVKIEAMAGRLASGQDPRAKFRRNYAVMQVTSKPVRIRLAPMRAG